MKKLIFLFAILVSFSSAISQNESAIKTEYPIITFEKYLHNFDTLEYNGNGSFAFKFTNTGKIPLIISNAKGSCGCTVPTYPKDKAILPGESEYIKVTYDTKRYGTFTKTVTIYSNAKSSPETLTIKGFVKPKPPEVKFPVGNASGNGMAPYQK